MADRQSTYPVARPADVPKPMLPAAARWESIARKWRALAERRSAHHVELFNSGRWRHYYTDAEFLIAMRDAIIAARTWGALAPSVDENAVTADQAGAAELQPEPASAAIELRHAA